MSGPQLLIVTIILVFVIAFIITMILLNNHAKSIISTNKKLVENQNTLLEQNMQHEIALEKRISELEEQLKHPPMDEVALLQKQTRQHREHIELTARSHSFLMTLQYGMTVLT
ncbi:MAG: hypothetical protein J6P73_05875 [Bacteroidales bacterium]|nr:hypothetical protein [Bacteroidales bacterium]